AVLQLAREQGPALIELAEYVAAEARVLLQEVAPPAVPGQCVRAPDPLHLCADQRQRFDRPDEGIPFEELPLDPEQAVELAGVISTQPAPEHTLLGRRHGRDWIELKEPEPPHGLEHPTCGAVQQLSPNGD